MAVSLHCEHCLETSRVLDIVPFLKFSQQLLARCESYLDGGKLNAVKKVIYLQLLLQLGLLYQTLMSDIHAALVG